MHIPCPSCGVAVEIDRLVITSLHCACCGSTINTDPEATGAYTSAGETLASVGRFQVLEAVGSGAFGVVYKARDPQLDRVVAIKVPRSGKLPGPQETERFLREARSAAQLRHPHIVTIFEVGDANGVPFIVSDFIQGVTLADLLATRRPSFSETAAIVADLADALHYAHGMGVIHRDVKPSNIMLEKATNAPKLMDFGLAKRETVDATLTVEGQLLGTPAYMSPEQARGEGRLADARADIYSLGAVLYLLLTGKLPFQGSARMVLHQVLSDEPRPPRQLDRHIPRDLETICLKAMAKDPAGRYASAGELAADLRRHLRGEPIHARRLAEFRQVWRWCRRNRLLVGLALMTAAVLAGLGITTTSLRLSESRARDAFELARKTLNDSFDRNMQLESMTHEQRSALREQVAAAVPFYENFARLRPRDRDMQRELGRIYALLGLIDGMIGDWNKSQASFQKAHIVFDALVRAHPDDVISRDYLAGSFTNLGLLMQLQVQMKEAEEYFQKALTLRRGLLSEFPNDPLVRRNVAFDFDTWGVFLQTNNRLAEAEAAYREALGVNELSRGEKEEEASYLSLLGAFSLHLGAILEAQGRHSDADAAYDRGLSTLRDFVTLGMKREFVFAGQPNPESVRADHPLVNCITLSRAAHGRYSVEALRKPVNFYQRAVDGSPKSTRLRQQLAHSHFFLGMMLLTQSHSVADAERSLQKCIELLDALERQHPDQSPFFVDTAWLCVHAAVIRFNRGENDEALQWAVRALASLRKVEKPDDPALLTRLFADAYFVEAGVSFRRDQFAPTLHGLDRMIAFDPSRRAVLNDSILRIVFRAQDQALTLSREGRHDEAVAQCRLIMDTKLATGIAFYEAACVLARASSAAPDSVQKERLAADAVAALGEAFRRGFQDGLESANAFRGEDPLDYMATDPDLECLRHRDDYKRWLHDVRAPRG